MSEQLREQLVDQLGADRPKFQGFLQERPDDISNSWDMIAWSYQMAFDQLWDIVKDGKHMLVRPLLGLCRQSIELTIKSSLFQITRAEPKPSHNLADLFNKLKKEIRKYEPQHDDYDAEVEAQVQEIQRFDENATRFRYPTQTGKYFDGLDVDLDRLFQAHCMIVTWCEGSAAELGRKHGVGIPDI